MFDQWFGVPEDQPTLPPVDEDICGLKDFLQFPNDLWVHQNELSSGGLLLGPDICHNLHHGADSDTLDAIALFPNAGQNASLRASDSPSTSGSASLCPPALSPDSSPNSVASSPWLRTPENPSLPNAVPNFTQVESLWSIAESGNIAETEEPSGFPVHFLDQSGNILEDITSQVQDVMPEDIACTPQTTFMASLPPGLTATPCTPLPNTPVFVVSPPGASTSSRTETVPHGQAYCMSLPPSPHISQSLFEISHPGEIGPGACHTSPSLSPLSTLSYFSQSPRTSSNPSPLSRCSLLSPAFSTVSLPNSDETVEVTGPVSSTPSGVTLALRAKRNAETLDDDDVAPPCKISRRSKAKNVDEEEWSPGHERLKRPRAASSSRSTGPRTPNYPPDESSDCATNQGPGEQSDTTCKTCGKIFTRKSDLTRHIENSSSHPETSKVWRCPHCDSPLGRKDALMRHVKTIHPGKPAFIPKGMPGNQLPKSQEPFKQPMGQRKMTSRRQAKKDMRGYR